MARISLTGLGSSLSNLLLTNDDIIPGVDASYQLCKAIYTYHILGRKLAMKPITMAQSQRREIAVPDSPEERVVEAFERQWLRDHADRYIRTTATLARIYGIATVSVLVKDQPTDKPLNIETLWKDDISFNTFDPLNTAGSMVLNQDPNAMDFQHTTDIRVAGKTYHRSRSCIIMNEEPIYIDYTNSAFGYVGRSVYQRALYPLKSLLQTMVTDDMVSRKAGVIVTKIKPAGSIVDAAMGFLTGTKRNVVKEAENDNVISVGNEDDVASIDLTNIDAAAKGARHNILENIAAAAEMPAKLLTQESMAEGFGEGTEDAKEIARYVDGVREWMAPLYDFFDRIIMHRAWNPDFYKTIQADFPDEYGDMEYKDAFYQWKNSFVAVWPNLLKEPDSEKVKVEDVQLRAIISLIEVLTPNADPVSRAEILKWACDNINTMKFLFPNPLQLDFEVLAQHMEEKQKADDEAKKAGVAAQSGEDINVAGEPAGLKRSDSVGDFRAAVRAITDGKKKQA